MSRIKNFIIYFNILIISSLTIVAQVKISVFKPGDSTVAKSPDKLYEARNAIKLNTFAFFTGIYMIEYERYIKGNTTAEIAVGICREVGSVSLVRFLKNDKYDIDHLSDREETDYTINFSCEAGARVYLGGWDELEGFYIHSLFAYRKYGANYVEEYFHQPQTSITPLETSIRFMDIQMRMGYQWTSIAFDKHSVWSNVPLTFEIYAGIACRSADVHYYSDVLDNMSSQFVHVPAYEKLFYIAPLIGLKCGYFF